MHIYSVTQNRATSSLLNSKKESNLSFENLINKQTPQIPSTTKPSFASLGPSSPDSVKNAWIKASMDTNLNGYGKTSKGEFNHISAMLTLQSRQIYKDGNADFLGDSVFSAISATEKALDLLNNPSNARFHTNSADESKEKAFYETFLKYLKEIK